MGDGESETAKAGETVEKTRLKARKTALKRFTTRDFKKGFGNNINMVETVNHQRIGGAAAGCCAAR
jgi:hypothetical protein